MRELERSITCAELVEWEGYFVVSLEERREAAEKGYYDPSYWD